MIHLPGWRNIPSARTLSIMIVLAGIGLIVSIVSLLYLTQHLIGLKANEIDKHRSVLSVDGAVQTSVNRVLSLVMDNAIWDDAVHQTYADRLDPQWLYNSWGSGFKINNLYDGTLYSTSTIGCCGDRFAVRALPSRIPNSSATVFVRLSRSMPPRCAAVKALMPASREPAPVLRLLVLA
jgi:hypothetical protein